MHCPFCNSDTRIYNSRGTNNSTQTWRRHRCLSCSRTFTTKERVDWTGRITIATPDDAAAYDRNRLLLSIAKAGQYLELSVGTASDLTDTVENELARNWFFSTDSQPSSTIIETAMDVLAHFDTNTALQYINNVYRSKPPRELLERLLGLENSLSA